MKYDIYRRKSVAEKLYLPDRGIGAAAISGPSEEWCLALGLDQLPTGWFSAGGGGGCPAPMDGAMRLNLK